MLSRNDLLEFFNTLDIDNSFSTSRCDRRGKWGDEKFSQFIDVLVIDDMVIRIFSEDDEDLNMMVESVVVIDGFFGFADDSVLFTWDSSMPISDLDNDLSSFFSKRL